VGYHVHFELVSLVLRTAKRLTLQSVGPNPRLLSLMQDSFTRNPSLLKSHFLNDLPGT
jgi:hypothetical protein